MIPVQRGIDNFTSSKEFIETLLALDYTNTQDLAKASALVKVLDGEPLLEERKYEKIEPDKFYNTGIKITYSELDGSKVYTCTKEHFNSNPSVIPYHKVCSFERSKQYYSSPTKTFTYYNEGTVTYDLEQGGNIIKYNGEYYLVTVDFISDNEFPLTNTIELKEFSPNTAYEKDDLILYIDTVYKAVEDFVSEDTLLVYPVFHSEYWEYVEVSSFQDTYASPKDHFSVLYNDLILFDIYHKSLTGSGPDYAEIISQREEAFQAWLQDYNSITGEENCDYDYPILSRSTSVSFSDLEVLLSEKIANKEIESAVCLVDKVCSKTLFQEEVEKEKSIVSLPSVAESSASVKESSLEVQRKSLKDEEDLYLRLYDEIYRIIHSVFILPKEDPEIEEFIPNVTYTVGEKFIFSNTVYKVLVEEFNVAEFNYEEHCYRNNYVTNQIGLAESWKPDTYYVTGDLINSSVNALYPPGTGGLSDMKTGKNEGVWICKNTHKSHATLACPFYITSNITGSAVYGYFDINNNLVCYATPTLDHASPDPTWTKVTLWVRPDYDYSNLPYLVIQDDKTITQTPEELRDAFGGFFPLIIKHLKYGASGGSTNYYTWVFEDENEYDDEGNILTDPPLPTGVTLSPNTILTSNYKDSEGDPLSSITDKALVSGEGWIMEVVNNYETTAAKEAVYDSSNIPVKKEMFDYCSLLGMDGHIFTYSDVQTTGEKNTKIEKLIGLAFVPPRETVAPFAKCCYGTTPGQTDPDTLQLIGSSEPQMLCTECGFIFDALFYNDILMCPKCNSGPDYIEEITPARERKYPFPPLNCGKHKPWTIPQENYSPILFGIKSNRLGFAYEDDVSSHSIGSLSITNGRMVIPKKGHYCKTTDISTDDDWCDCDAMFGCWCLDFDPVNLEHKVNSNKDLINNVRWRKKIWINWPFIDPDWMCQYNKNYNLIWPGDGRCVKPDMWDSSSPVPAHSCWNKQQCISASESVDPDNVKYGDNIDPKWPHNYGNSIDALKGDWCDKYAKPISNKPIDGFTPKCTNEVDPSHTINHWGDVYGQSAEGFEKFMFCYYEDHGIYVKETYIKSIFGRTRLRGGPDSINGIEALSSSPGSLTYQRFAVLCMRLATLIKKRDGETLGIGPKQIKEILSNVVIPDMKSTQSAQFNDIRRKRLSLLDITKE